MAPTLETLASFDGIDGSTPYSELVADARGDLFGTNTRGGANNDGTVFEIARNVDGSYASTPQTLVAFHGPDGAVPEAGLIADAQGDLFGTTDVGGAQLYGTAFEIARNTDGSYASTSQTLVSFDKTDGRFPSAALIADAQGDMFGTTSEGGAQDAGTVFEIARNTDGSYASTPQVLASFHKSDGDVPLAGLIADSRGDLFGTTEYHGAHDGGTVFEIVRNGDGSYASTPQVLVSFDDTDGVGPQGSLIADAQGDLFGTTSGGGANGDGAVFEITRSTDGTYALAPQVLASFDGVDGNVPIAGLIADAQGDLFGTTEVGGANNDGTVFKIARNTDGTYASTPQTLLSFDGTDGSNPRAGLIADARGNLFGTTFRGGEKGDGTVFEITDTGFFTKPLLPTVASIAAGNVNLAAGTLDFTVTFSGMATGFDASNVALSGLAGATVTGITTTDDTTYQVAVSIGTGSSSGTLKLAVTGAETGSFPTTPVTSSGAGGPYAQAYDLAVGSFAGPGSTDVALADPGGSTVHIAAAQSDGSFAALATVSTVPAGATFSNPDSLAVGDFNGDGIPDLAVSNNAIDYPGPFGIPTSTNGDIAILSGKGDGTFNAPTFVSVGDTQFPSSIATGDFNGDGILDLVTADVNQPGTTNNQISVVSGNGDGTFSAPSLYTLKDAPSFVATGDLTGQDGTSDVVVSTAAGIAIVRGGDFANPTYLDIGQTSGKAAIGDLNGDGIPDIVVPTYAGLAVLLGIGDPNGKATGTFAAPAFITPPQGTFQAATIADMTGDGVPDIVASLGDGFVLLTGKGDGTFTTGTPHFSGTDPSLAVADVDGDGVPDVILPAYASVSSQYSDPVDTFLNSDGPTGSVYINRTPGAASLTVSSDNYFSPNPSDLGAGHIVTIAVRISQLFTISGPIILQLNNGVTVAGTVAAAYGGVSGPPYGAMDYLKFTYTVKAGDNEDTPDLKVTGLAPGSGTITDILGNPVSIAGDTHLQIDTTAPRVEAVTQLDKVVTNAATVDYDVTFSKPVQNVARSLVIDPSSTDTGASIASVTQVGTPSPGGPVTYDVTLDIGDGDGTLKFGFGSAIADSAGNPLAAPPAVPAYTIDVTPPALTITSAGGPLNLKHQTITGTIDPADAGTIVTLLDNGVAIGTPAMVANDGTWRESLTLAPGANVITASATDIAGNTGTSNAVTYTYTLPPLATPTIDPPPGLTNNPAPTITGTGVAGSTITLADSAQVYNPLAKRFETKVTALGATTVGTDGTWSLTLGESGVPALQTEDTLSDATAFTFSATASETGFGPSTAATSSKLDLDETPPDIALTTASQTNVAPATVNGTITGNSGNPSGDLDGSLSVTITDADTYDGVTTTTATTVIATSTTGTSGAFSVPFTPVLGTHVITASATDAAGNTGTSAPVTIEIDHTPPGVAIDSIGQGPNNVLSDDDLSSGLVVYGTTTIPTPTSVTLELDELKEAFNAVGNDLGYQTFQAVAPTFKAVLNGGGTWGRELPTADLNQLTAGATYRLDATVSDGTSSAETTQTFVVHNTPTITSASVQGQPSGATLTYPNSYAVTLTLNQAVTVEGTGLKLGFNNGEFAAYTGTVGTPTQTLNFSYAPQGDATADLVAEGLEGVNIVDAGGFVALTTVLNRDLSVEVSGTVPPGEVTTAADSGAGSLRAAITYANTHPGTTITFSRALLGDAVHLASDLPVITGNNTVIDGGTNDITIDGGGNDRGFFVGDSVNPVTATIENLDINNTLAKGGDGGGGPGAVGGGGGGGLGGAVFVADNASLTISGLQFANDAADGGNGGYDPFSSIFDYEPGSATDQLYDGSLGYGGGGGLDGNGGVGFKGAETLDGDGFSPSQIGENDYGDAGTFYDASPGGGGGGGGLGSGANGGVSTGGTGGAGDLSGATVGGSSTDGNRGGIQAGGGGSAEKLSNTATDPDAAGTSGYGDFNGNFSAGGGGGQGASGGDFAQAGNGGFGGGGGGSSEAGGMGGFGGGGGGGTQYNLPTITGPDLAGAGGWGGGGGGFYQLDLVNTGQYTYRYPYDDTFDYSSTVPGGFGAGAGTGTNVGQGAPLGDPRQGGSGAGGGGLGAGGALFVMGGGNLTIGGSVSESGSSVAGGLSGLLISAFGYSFTAQEVQENGGSAAPYDGDAYGSALFLQGGTGTTTFDPGAGQRQSFTGTVADEAGNGGTASRGIVKNGLGTLEFAGANSYTGGTTINAGTFQIDQAGAAGTGAISFGTPGGTLFLNYSGTAAPNINYASFAVGDTISLKDQSQPFQTVDAVLVKLDGNRVVATGNSLTLTAAPPSASKAMDGYIAGAKVSYANGSGPSTTTDDEGNFNLTGGTGPIQVTGGTDISTGLSFTGTLTAPEGSTIVSPLTTLVEAVLKANPTENTADATKAVATALGLPASTDLLDLDAVAKTQAGDATGTAAFKAGSALLDAVTLIAAAGGSADQAYAAAAAAIATAAATMTTIDLTAPATIEAIGEAAGLATASAQGVADIVTAAAMALDAALATAATPAQVFDDITGASILQQGGAAKTLLALQNPTPDGYRTASDAFAQNVPATLAADIATAAADNPPCYCRGTAILTANGERSVEDLAIGDRLVTASGAPRPIKWIGTRSYAGRFANANPGVLPICFKAGALTDNTPRRDLWVSPKHAMFIDGVLIPAEHLVNGVSIIQADRVDRVDYFHIELDSHDVIVAEGALSESFVDDNSRAMFHNAREFAALYPDAEPVEAIYCAPRVEDGFALEAVRRRLAERAGQPAAAATEPGLLRGFVERIKGGRVYGWAQSAGHPDGTVCLDVLVDGRMVMQVLADRFRSDLLHAGIGDGQHAFEARLPETRLTGEVTMRRSADRSALPSLSPIGELASPRCLASDALAKATETLVGPQCKEVIQQAHNQARAYAGRIPPAMTSNMQFAFPS